jgi:hypothetical protein
MAKSFNFTLFFKKNETLLMVVGLVILAMFFFGFNGDMIGNIQFLSGNSNSQAIPLANKPGGCQRIEEVN